MTFRKLQFGCGGNRLTDWENFDSDVDISKPLPFPDGCASFIFAEHVIEHVTHQEAWGFLEECHRILCVGGVIRVAIPDVLKIFWDCTPEYAEAVKASGFGNGTQFDAIKAAVFCHGHKAAWTHKTLLAFLLGTGFKNVSDWTIGNSPHPELRNIEGHGKVVGEDIARVETTCMEGTKL